jgi:lysophospholipase L1-like esterase
VPGVPTLGVLAFGDSITNGGGELQWGVALQSWALWVARALGLPFTGFATDGARTADVVARQIPAFLRRAADPDARYDVGCLYIGVNDVRGFDWDPGAFESEFREAVAFVAARCERMLVVTIPLGVGLPPAGAKVDEANRIIEAAAGDIGALVCDLRGFSGRRLVMADQVHPTAFGQIAIASKALEALAADGLEARADPWDMVEWDETALGRLRGDATYAYRRAKEELRALARQTLK